MSHVSSWGYNVHGELGVGYYGAITPEPYLSAEFGEDVKQICAAGGSTLALLSNGTVIGVGGSRYGQLGIEDPRVIHPVEIPFGASIKQLASAGGHVIALDENGEVWTLGGSMCGTLGNGETGHGHEYETCWNPVPQHLSLTDIVYVATGGAVCAVVHADGTVSTWGENRQGQLGDGTTTERPEPVKIDIEDVVKISIGGMTTLPTHCVALLGDGTVKAWGAGVGAQLGQGVLPGKGKKLPNSSVPIFIPTLSHIVDVVAGSLSTFALDDDGDLHACGSNVRHQLGTGELDELVPTPRVVLDDVTDFASGYQFCAAIRKGELYTWGKNNRGCCGDGTLDDKASPVLIDAVSDILGIDCGETHMAVMLRGAAPPVTIKLTPELEALRIEWESVEPQTGKFYVAIRPWTEDVDPLKFTQLGLDRSAREHTFTGLTSGVVYEVAVSNAEVFKRRTLSAAAL